MEKMKVRVTLTLEVDPDVWDMTYGPTGETQAKRVREDVKTYVLGQVTGSAAYEEGCILEAAAV